MKIKEDGSTCARRPERRKSMSIKKSKLDLNVLYAAIIDQVPDGIFICDMALNIIAMIAETFMKPVNFPR